MKKEKKLRSRIKRAYKELQEYMEDRIDHHEKQWITEYENAIRELDLPVLDWYETLGHTMRHRIMNRAFHHRAKAFGFTEIVIGKYGWMERPEFNDIEEFTFKVGPDDNYPNKLVIGRGNNTKWTYGYRMEFGTSGSSSGVDIHNEVYNSREEALNAGIGYFKERFMEARKNTDDTSNYNPKIISAVLRQLDEFMAKKQQLTLF